MRLLICSDGTDTADKPAQLGGLVAGPCEAEVTLLGVAEGAKSEDELRAALESEAKMLGQFQISPKIVLRTGEPIEEILQETKAATYDLVVIGARIKRRGGAYWRSKRTYEVIKAIPPPVLVATGGCAGLTSILVCTGGRRYSDAAVELAGRIAAANKAAVTLLHVMAEPPALYAEMTRREEDLTALLEGGSELGRNLQAQKESLDKVGVPAAVAVRHGDVITQIFREQRRGEHNLIVTGSSRARGTFQHYIMGDLTRSILNRATCPILIARSDKISGGFWNTLKEIFSSGR